VIMSVGHVNVDTVHHVSTYTLPNWLSLPITLIFIIGVTNAINLADGLDGLAGGSSLLCLSGLAWLAFTGGSGFVGFAAMVAIGAVLGFLRYNTHPARIFMGDAGSQLLGFSIAVLSLVLTQDKSLPYSASLPLLLVGVPVIDTLTVMTERVLDGKSPFQADRTHVHHRLLSLGFDHNEAVMVIYGAQAVLLVLAWYFRYASDLLIVSVFAVVAISIVTILQQARRRHWQWRAMNTQGALPRRSWLQRKINWLYAGERLNRWVGYTMGVAIVAYGALVMSNNVEVPVDIRVLACVAAVVVLVSIVVRRAGSEAGWLERAALYTSALIAVYLDRDGTLSPTFKLTMECVIFIAMLLAIVMRLRLTTDRRFRITPLDLLVLLVAVALPNLPGSVLSNHVAGWMIWKTLVLFYCIENLSVSAGFQWRILTGGTLMFLTVVVLRAAM
jgi:UDP-GlcNAc:undecaprenyl-phosphate GlcNAc-1-phosphate transferase